MRAEVDLGQLLWVGLLLCVFLIAAFGAVLMVRKIFRSDRTGNHPTKGFTLEGLQEMHAAGQISGDEFKRLKEEYIADMKKS